MDDKIPPVEEEHDDDVLETVADRLRDMPVGLFDPNIIGDADPHALDVPPGSDPPDPDLPDPVLLDPETGAVID
ncbi:MAG: hypothetical protein ACR2MO_02735 [Acidimicrobiales bacterium]